MCVCIYIYIYTHMLTYNVLTVCVCVTVYHMSYSCMHPRVQMDMSCVCDECMWHLCVACASQQQARLLKDQPQHLGKAVLVQYCFDTMAGALDCSLVLEVSSHE